MEQISECQICYSNSSNIITCTACDYKSCNVCLKTYFEDVLEPQCPQCHVIMTREFISKNIKGSLLKQIVKMRENVLVQHEIALLPDTQAAAIAHRDLKIIKDELNILVESRKKLNKKLSGINSQIIAKRSRIADAKKSPVKKSSVGCICPAVGCRGFVNNDTWKCGVCSSDVCSDCLELIIQPPDDVEFNIHTCNADSIKSALEISKSCKQCPGCNVMVFKTDGCDQMWCVRCHTAFSWTSGFLEKGAVHNPHFYEWQRNMNHGEAPQDCQDAYVRYSDLNRVLPLRTPDMYNLQVKIDMFHQAVAHIYGTFHHIDPPFETVVPQDDLNKDLRIKFILGEITHEQLASHVQRRDKRIQKKAQQCEMVNMLNMGAVQILKQFIEKCDKKVATLENMQEASAQIDSLLEVYNKSLTDIESQFGGTVEGRLRYSETFGDRIDVQGLYTDPNTGFPCFTCKMSGFTGRFY